MNHLFPARSILPMLLLGLAIASALLSAAPASGREPADQSDRADTEVTWHADYGQALEIARKQGKMLLVVFYRPGNGSSEDRFESTVLHDPAVLKRLQRHVCVRLPLDTRIRCNGKEISLLAHRSFARLRGKPGMAVLDFVQREAPYYGWVVGAVPLASDGGPSADQTAILLDLPPGTLDERMKIYASRTAVGETSGREHAAATEDVQSQEDSATWTAEGWHTDYDVAVQQAKRQNKMLFVRFFGSRLNLRCRRLDTVTLADSAVRERLKDYICVRLPVGATVEAEGEKTAMPRHRAFAEMRGRPGVAILDFVEPESDSYGRVVSTFPLVMGLSYTPAQMKVILGLPRGTLSQRTMIYAVRTHPDRPASTQGQIDTFLLEQAASHSAYQAQIRLQGHHRWETRIHQIKAKLPPNMTAVEVCAQSWPGEGIVEAAIGCVFCWRQSSGHWNAVRARQPFYGYDMKRGSNGIWYATGIFGKH
ncbi:MAG: thioredoxin family protein [Pirellulales bacterium]|nr:thioredoxin family protein [Pirellulales bacterium]